MLALGLLYSAGFGVPKDLTEGVKWFHKAEEEGNIQAMYMLGIYYLETQQVTLGMDYIRKAADLGHVEAKDHLAHSDKTQQQKEPMQSTEHISQQKLEYAENKITTQYDRIGGLLDKPESVIEALEITDIWQKYVITYAVTRYNNNTARSLSVKYENLYKALLEQASITGAGMTQEASQALEDCNSWIDISEYTASVHLKSAYFVREVINNNQKDNWNLAVVQLMQMENIPGKYKNEIKIIK
jgi:hypothetical protein